MQYRYRAYNLRTGVVEGRIGAEDEAEARKEVEAQGYQVLRVRSIQGARLWGKIHASLFQVKSGEVIRFAQDLSTLLNSGGNLLRCLERLEATTNDRRFRKVLVEVKSSLDRGRSLSEALSQHPQVFSRLFVSVVEVGEATGRLAPALDQIAEILTKEREVKQKALRTLMYPVAIMGLSILTLAVLMVFALPSLLDVLDQMGAEVPFITKVALVAAVTVKGGFNEIFIGLIASASVVLLLQRIPRTKRWIHIFQARAPLIGPFITTSEITRFSRTMAMLLGAGVPLVRALDLGIDGSKNLTFQDAFADAKESLLSGKSLAEALRRHSNLPTVFTELVVIGEEGNALQRVMHDAALRYQQTLEQRLNSLLGVLEPASTLVVGGVVAFLAFSMFAPIYSGLNAIK